MQSLKLTVFNFFRQIFKISFLENWIVQKTQDKPENSFWVKLLPNNKQYETPSLRLATRKGIKFKLDISDYMEYIIYFGVKTEPREILYNLISPKMTILDIGTNIGETLLNFAKINKNGLNYGFEPVPYLHERAKSNISLNNFTNITLNNIAISDKEEKLFFSLPSNNNSGGISMSKYLQTGMQEVSAIPLDSFVLQNNILGVDLIKIDVEGFETNVIRGGQETLKKYKPLLFIELSDNLLKKQNSSAKELVTLLISLGYQLNHAENQQVITENYHFENTHFDIICK